MNKKTKLVLDLLKPKASSLGFSKEELEGVATNIANNLVVDDDAADDVLSEAVTKAVDAAMPFLELSQKNANRIIQKNKEEREKAEAEAKKAAAEARKKAEEEAAKKAKEEEERKRAEEEGLQKFYESGWAKNMKAENEKLAKQLKAQQEAAQKAQEEFNSFREEFKAMKAERTKADREKKLESLLNGTGVFGERIKKNFARMSFDTDEDFNEFIDGVQDDIKAFNQERADKGLEKLGTPAKGEQEEIGKVEPMTDAEVDALANIM